MSLSNLYLLRIVQLEVYIQFLQEAVDLSNNKSVISQLKALQRNYLEERKQIRRFLNMTELWRLKNA